MIIITIIVVILLYLLSFAWFLWYCEREMPHLGVVLTSRYIRLKTMYHMLTVNQKKYIIVSIRFLLILLLREKIFSLNFILNESKFIRTPIDVIGII